MLYDDGHATQIGYCTSFVYSPVLQRHIGLARVRPDLAAAGTELRLELALAHHNTTVGVRTTKLPFFNPEEDGMTTTSSTARRRTTPSSSAAATTG